MRPRLPRPVDGLIQLPPPARGEDTTAAPISLPADAAQDTTNLLLDQPGRIRLRGPLPTPVSWPVAANTAAPAALVPGLPNALAIGIWGDTNRNLYVAQIQDDGTPALIGHHALAGTNAMSGAWARVGDNFYLGTQGGSGIVQWDGAATLVGQTRLDYAPWQVTDLEDFTNRLMVLGGTTPAVISGGGTYHSTYLYWSDPAVGADAAASWQDDVSGLTNQLALPDEGVALAKIGTALAIFCKRTVHLLTGSGPTNWARRQVLQRDLIHRDGLTARADVAYFMSKDGLFAFDGAQETLLSEPINRVLQPLLRVYDSTLLVRPVVEDAGNGHLYVAVWHQDRVTFAPTLKCAWLYNVATGAWSKFVTSSAVSAQTAPVLVRKTYDRVAAVDCNRLWNFERAAIGADPAGGVVGGVDAGAASKRIGSRYLSPLLQLGSPGSRAFVKRVVIDYRWQENGVAPTSTGWLVKFYDHGGLLPFGGTTALTVNTLSGDQWTRQSIDLNTEVEDLTVEITTDATAAAATVFAAEIYNITIEFTAAQQSAGY